jgi:hypothetical protein
MDKMWVSIGFQVWCPMAILLEHSLLVFMVFAGLQIGSSLRLNIIITSDAG